MKTWFKRILVGLVVVVLVAVVGLAIFLLTFDPNAYKQRLAEFIHERYDRTLTVDGEIELSLFPRIGLSLQDVALSEPGSTDTFASIESARVSVAVFPLLSNNLVVDHIAISGFKGRFVRDKDGAYNFDDLVHKQAGEGALSTDGTLLGTPVGDDDATALRLAGADTGSGFQIDIAGLDLQDGEILLQDEMTGRAVALNDLNLNTGRVTFNQAFNATLRAHVEGGNPRMDARLSGQGLLTLNPAARRYAVQKLDVQLTGQLPGAVAKSAVARGSLAFDGNENAVDISALEVLFQGEVNHADAPMKGVDASVAIPRLAWRPNNGQLDIDKLTVRATGTANKGPFEFAADAPALNISPSSAKGQPVTGRLRISGTDTLDATFALAGVSGNASELDIEEAKLGATAKTGDRLVKTAFTTPLTVNLVDRVLAMSAMRGDVAITDPALPKGSLQIPVIGSATADLRKDEATANVNAVLEGGKFDLAATVTALADTPRVAFNLTVDILDLDKLVPARSAPVLPPDADAATVAAAAAQRGAIDLSALVGPDINGSLKIGRLVVRGLKAQDVSGRVALNQGKLDVSELAASLYEGSLTGAASVNAAANNAMSAKVSLAGVALEPLLNDLAGHTAITGRGTVDLDITTAGANTYALRTGLDGTARVRLDEGAIRGIDVARTLRDLLAMFHRERAAAAAASADAQATTADATPATETPGPSEGSASGATPAAPEAGTTTASAATPPAPAATAARPPASSAATTPAPAVSTATPPAPEAATTPAPAVATAAPPAPEPATAPAPATSAATPPAPEATTPAPAAPAAGVVQPAPASGDVSTPFTTLASDLVFENGIVGIKSLDMRSPLLQIKQGDPATLNLIENTIDLVTLVRVVSTGKESADADLAELRNIAIPVKFVGPLRKPLFSIQWRAAAEQLLGNAVGDKVVKALGGHEPGRQDTARQVGDALKGLLKR